MSTRIMSDCWGLVMPPTHKAVLISLADQANDQGVCWPSIATLCERTCLAERTVRNAIRALELAGGLTVSIGAMRSNKYTIRPADFKRPPTDAAQLDSVTTGAPRAPLDPVTKGAPRAGQPAPGAGQGGTTCPQTVIEPNTNTETPNPLTPTVQGGSDLFADASKSETPTRRGKPVGELRSLPSWLDECKARGEQPIPDGDPVFAYADDVGLAREILELHWHEFKRRRARTRKLQRDWRQTFRNSVEGNWFGLWWLPPNGPAELTSKGRQAQAARAAAAITRESTP